MKGHRPGFLEIIKSQIQKNNLSHAYLIFGDLSLDDLRKVFRVSSADYFILNEKPIKINHIRELLHWLNLRPHSSLVRLIILAEAENLTLEAANALLKMLEEPPSYAVFVLQAYKKDKMLPTILSRCEVVREKVLLTTQPDNYFSPEQIGKMTIKERFDYVNKISKDKESVAGIINLWENFFHEKLLKGDDFCQVINACAATRRLLSLNTSVKLLLENLILKF